MKKHRSLKTLTACLLTLAAFVSLALLTPIKADAATEDIYTYEVYDGKVKITACDASTSSITIPATLGGYPVTSIGEFAFSNSVDLTDITIPDSVTWIDNSAFLYCRLTGIWVDEGNANYSSDSKGVLFNKDKTVLIRVPHEIRGNYAIPNGVTTVTGGAFWSCSVSNITIPASVTNIADSFNWCETGIWVDENNPVYSSDGYGVLFNKDKTELIRCAMSCEEGQGYIIPNGVTTIKDAAFQNSSLASITIPDSVTTIDCAFTNIYDLEVYITDMEAWCSISFADGEDANPLSCYGKLYLNGTLVTKLIVPEGVTNIGDRAFCQYAFLTDVSIPDSVTSIGDSAFSNCDSLTDVYYAGGQSQWNAISIGSDNEVLTGATIHYNHPAHDFTADTTTCSLCGYVRAGVDITNVVLRPSCSGLYFKGSFTFGAEETVTGYGIVVSLYNALPVADDSDETSRYTIGETSVLISNILDSSNGKNLIYARPYALLADGTYIYGNVVCTNLKAVVETLDAQVFTGLSAAQKEALTAMYQQFTSVMQDWLIPEIKKYA